MKILLAEDDNNLRETLTEGLRSLGYEVMAVANGAAAVEHINGDYDVAILDGLLPKVTGFDVAKLVRSRSPATAIILISGVFKSSQQQTDHMAATGAKAYLVKPFDLRRLTDTLRPYAPAEAASAVADDEDSEPSGLELPSQGSLLEMPALYLGWRIHKEQQTGILELFSASEKARIFAYRGRAVFAQSSQPLLHIGVELLKDGTISAEQFQISAELAVQRGVGLFEILKGEGMATEAQMKAAYKGLVPRIVERTPALTGTFRWAATDAFSSIVPAASSSLIDGMLGGLAKITEKELEPHIAPRRSLRLAPGENWDEVVALLKSSCGSDSLTRAINGRATIAQLLEVSPTPQERATRFRQTFVLMSTMAVRASEQVISMAVVAPAPHVEPQQVPTAAAAVVPRAASPEMPGEAARGDADDANKVFTAQDEEARVKRGADPGSVKKSFYALSREFHPDSFAGVSLGSVTPKLELLFQQIQGAYATLSDDAKRGEYEAKINIEAGGGSSDIGALFQAESDFQKVKFLYDRGDLAGGQKIIDRVVKIMANNEEAQGYKLFLDWWSTKSVDSADSVVRELLVLYKRAPAAVALRDLMGWIYMEIGNLNSAKTAFRKVIEIQPKHVGANRGMTQLHRKVDEAAKGGGSALGRFFGGDKGKS